MRTYSRTRAWSEAEFDAAAERLRTRGLIDGDGFTAAGRDAREAIEVATDEQMRPALDALGDDVDELCSILEPWGAAVRAGGGYLANGPHDLARTPMIITDLDRRSPIDAVRRIAPDGTPKPQGLCRGEVCVPAPGASRDDGTIDVSLAAERLGMPLVHDADAGVWALGPAPTSGRVLSTAIAADPDADRPRR